ncbi:MBL fold metallo-hydrolase [Alteromonas sp. AMM-1]|uniref:MBL fold metallo-hydrolase n=1 Tax=Alteromonas sp. AMM-1 TaxID=3394233 RepID=UPI0039A4C521
MITLTSHPTPASGEWTLLSEDLWWLRMPLPFELDHINLYVLEDTNGIVVVDTGLSSRRSKAIWQACFEQFNKPLLAVVVTHMHPDHCGLVGWLCREFDVPLYMSALEYFAARSIFGPNPGADLTTDKRYFQRAGVEQSIIDQHVKPRESYTEGVEPLPLAFRRLKHGETLQVAGKSWLIMTFAGHSPEHVCLYNCEQKLLIGGDQILPQISPNIGVYSQEPEANPLADYFTSLSALAEMPADTLVLPSHNVPYIGLPHRAVELRQHHQAQLDALETFCETPRSLVECLPVMYKRPLTGRHMFFAVAECLSHLNYLMYASRLVRTESNAGVYLYQRCE